MSSGMGKSMILMEVNLKKERKNKQNKMVQQGECWFSVEWHYWP